MTHKIIDLMKYKNRSPDEVSYDNKWVPPWHYYLTQFDVDQLRGIAMSKRLSGRVSEKMKLIKNIMGNRGFVRMAGGTNRVVFRHYEDPRIVAKVALDSVGMQDNPAEYENQWFIRPFCAKTFSVSPCGTVAISERVMPFTSVEDYLSVVDNVFDVIYLIILGKYIMEDIGTDYFMNWGIRVGFGVVLLDYPYIYELDGAKLYCDNILENGYSCHGEIDYDEGFNRLQCKKCGRIYLAREMKKHINNNTIIIDKGGSLPMNVKIKRGSEIIAQKNECDYIVNVGNEVKKSIEEARKNGSMIVSVKHGSTVVDTRAVDNDNWQRGGDKLMETEVDTTDEISPVIENKETKEEIKPDPVEEKVEETPVENVKQILLDDRLSIRESVEVRTVDEKSTNRQMVGSTQSNNNSNSQVIGSNRVKIPMRSNFIPDEGDY